MDMEGDIKAKGFRLADDWKEQVISLVKEYDSEAEAEEDVLEEIGFNDEEDTLYKKL